MQCVYVGETLSVVHLNRSISSEIMGDFFFSSVKGAAGQICLGTSDLNFN